MGNSQNRTYRFPFRSGATSVSPAEPALEVLEQSAVDIPLVDLKLPEMSGLDLRKRVTELTLKYLCFVLTPAALIPRSGPRAFRP